MDREATSAKRTMLKRWWITGLALATTTLAAGAFALGHQRPASVVFPPPVYAASAPAVGPAVGPPVDSYATVVSRVAPSVVTIRAEKKAAPMPTAIFPDDPFLRQFFGDRFGRTPDHPRVPREIGLGSGVIVTSSGYVLTNHHVIDGAEEINVELSDRRRFDAKLVGSDPPSDLAVLKLAADNLPALPLGDSDHVRVGDIVLALGNPLGVGQTVTMGIVSAKGRSTELGDGGYQDFIQTDAPINRGNSGGALIDAHGALIGINSEIISPSGGNIGIGFAIPVNMARNVMNQLIADGAVHRGRLGVVVQDVNSDLAAGLSLSEVKGALVSDVESGGPAAKAGLERGDVIVGLNGKDVRDSNDLRNHVASLKPGSEVEVAALRNGTRREFRATLDEKGGGKRAQNNTPASGEGHLGMTVEPLTPELADSLGVKADHGLAVTDVDPDGAAARAGVARGDVIEEVNHHAVASAGQLRSALADSGSHPALVLVNRDGTRLFVALSRPNA